MTKYLPLAILFVSLMPVLAAGVFAQESNWESPPVSTQLEMDETIVPIGKGAVFVPYMTAPENEPVYGVLREGKMVEDSSAGQRIPLETGVYTVVYGSGTLDQMMQRTVRVVEGGTTLIKPDWSGLVIDVIDESRTKVREYYEILDLKTGTSYGIGQGVEQGLDERLRTWILSPGRYKIVKPGGNINDLQNFGTIRLEPGELVHAVLVIDSKSLNFLGFGYRTDVRQMSNLNRRWTTQSELAGNALINYVPSSESGAESDASFTGTVQWLTDVRYESGRHIIPIWSNLEEGLSMQKDRVLRKYIDKAELKLTYIYRFMNLMSPYVRTAVESRLFATSIRFDDPTDYLKVSDGDTVSVKGVKEIQLGGSLSPVYLKEGFGVNSILIKSMPLNCNIRAGYGARQTYSRESFLYNSSTSVLTNIPNARTTGVELLLLGDIRFGKFILLDTELDVLMPKSKTSSWVFDADNRLRLNLTSNISLLLTMEFWRYENMDKVQSRYQTLLRFSKFL